MIVKYVCIFKVKWKEKADCRQMEQFFSSSYWNYNLALSKHRITRNVPIGNTSEIFGKSKKCRLYEFENLRNLKSQNRQIWRMTLNNFEWFWLRFRSFWNNNSTLQTVLDKIKCFYQKHLKCWVYEFENLRNL